MRLRIALRVISFIAGYACVLLAFILDASLKPLAIGLLILGFILLAIALLIPFCKDTGIKGMML